MVRPSARLMLRPAIEYPEELAMTLATQPASLLRLEPVIEAYFSTFNRHQFSRTASLFAADGRLIAPFEEVPIIGPAAIQTYLEQEAADMVATPKILESDPLADGKRQVRVKGNVKASVFIVNVAWTYRLNADNQIEQVEVKLLASLQELVGLQSSSAQTR